MPGSITYLLEVCRPSGGRFRALLRAVDQEATLAFDSAQALGRHLEAATRPQTPSDSRAPAEPLHSHPQETLS